MHSLQVEIEFLYVGFCAGSKTGVLRELNPGHMDGRGELSPQRQLLLFLNLAFNLEVYLYHWKLYNCNIFFRQLFIT